MSGNDDTLVWGTPNGTLLESSLINLLDENKQVNFNDSNGRKSFGIERESLGILPTNSAYLCDNFLSTRALTADMSMERESLGILHLSSPNLNFKKPRRNKNFEDNKENDAERIFKTPKKYSSKRNNSLNKSNSLNDDTASPFSKMANDSFEFPKPLNLPKNNKTVVKEKPTVIPKVLSNSKLFDMNEDVFTSSNSPMTSNNFNLSGGDEPRESLGILNLNAMKLNGDLEMVPSPNMNENLNNGFLKLPSHRNKILSSASSVCSSISFNSASLDPIEFSTILTPNSEGVCFNDAFIKSDSASASALAVNSNTNSNNALTSTSSSTNVMETERTGQNKEAQYGQNVDEDVPLEVLQIQKKTEEQVERIRKCWSAQKPKKNISLLRRASCSNLSAICDEKESSHNFLNDSIRIEAQFLASKISDGSILEMPDSENMMLDDTPQPEFGDAEDSNISGKEEKTEKIDTEKVFKTVDKLFAVLPLINTQHNNKSQHNNSPKNSSLNEEAVIKDKNKKEEEADIKSPSNSEVISPISMQSDNQNTNFSCVTNETIDSLKSTSKIDEAKMRKGMQILQNLSQILNKNTLSPQTRLNGQNMLANFAHMFLNDEQSNATNQDNLDDSGRSSIENKIELPVFPEHDVLLHEKIESPKVLDLSLREKSVVANTNNSNSKLSNVGNVSKCSINNSGLSNSSKNSINDSKGSTKSLGLASLGIGEGVKLKPRKSEKTVIKNGPMKAIGPVAPLVRRNSFTNAKTQGNSIPVRAGKASPSLTLQTRTSTPKASHGIQPVAQSTPDGSGARNHVLSPLTRYSHNNFTNRSSGYLSSNQSWNRSTGNLSSKLPSAADSKRRFSTTTSTTSSAAVATIAKLASTAAGKNENTKKEETASGLPRERSRSLSLNIKPLNLVAKLKAAR